MTTVDQIYHEIRTLGLYQAMVEGGAYPRPDLSTYNAVGLGDSKEADKAQAELVRNSLSRLSGISHKWLGPVLPEIARLISMAKNTALTDDHLTAAATTFANRIPELFDRMNHDALADLISKSIGSAMTNGIVQGRRERAAGSVRAAQGKPCGQSHISRNKRCHQTGFQAEPARALAKLPPAQARHLLERGIKVTDPQGRKIKFGTEVLHHWEQETRKPAAEVERRLARLPQALSAIKNPHEIREHQGQINYYQFFHDPKNKLMSVWTTVSNGAVRSYLHDDRYSRVARPRKGKLLFEKKLQPGESTSAAYPTTYAVARSRGLSKAVNPHFEESQVVREMVDGSRFYDQYQMAGSKFKAEDARLNASRSFCSPFEPAIMAVQMDGVWRNFAFCKELQPGEPTSAAYPATYAVAENYPGEIFSTRPSCLLCVRKHISSAIVLMGEALNGYPLHRDLAGGHLNQAEEESIAEYPELARALRQSRLQIESGAHPDLLPLLEMARHLGELSASSPVSAGHHKNCTVGKIMSPGGRCMSKPSFPAKSGQDGDKLSPSSPSRRSVAYVDNFLKSKGLKTEEIHSPLLRRAMMVKNPYTAAELVESYSGVKHDSEKAIIDHEINKVLQIIPHRVVRDRRQIKVEISDDPQVYAHFDSPTSTFAINRKTLAYGGDLQRITHHEMGHWIQELGPKSDRNDMEKFYRRRTKGERMVALRYADKSPMKIAGENVRGKKDHWANEYTGAEIHPSYENKGVEMLSTHMEHFANARTISDPRDLEAFKVALAPLLRYR